jgi:thimet oligopeptidase
MSGNAKTVREFIDRIVAASGPAQDRDYRTLLERKKKDVPSATGIDAWENTYWQDMVKRSDYDFDAQSLRPYLPFSQVQQGILDVTSKMFGVTYKKVDVPVWHKSVDAYEVYEGSKRIGRFYLDMHPRPNKYNHAAQFDIRTGVEGKQIPEAALICNLPGGEPGDPGLCEIDDVDTFFHEFGHLLHAMFAGHRRWLGTSGIRTEHDFVEAPSQMLEEWMKDPKTLQTFAKHYQTGQPVPTELVNKMRRAQDFAKGLQVRRQMVYADLSLSIYDRDPAQVDIDAMMKEFVSRYQPFKYVDGTHFACAFGHLDGYSAVYYTYMWSLVIAKDMFSQFDRNQLLAPAIAAKYRDTILAPLSAGSAPAAKLVETFLGRPFSFEAYQRWLNQELTLDV